MLGWLDVSLRRKLAGVLLAALAAASLVFLVFLVTPTASGWSASARPLRRR
ncbi:MAG: hypothetical protein R3D28_16045 [Geminicoccaceae bacterium]